MSETVFVFALMCCAVWFGTRLIILEKVIDGTRDKVMMWLANRTTLWAVKLYELLGCPWCVSFWLAVTITTVADDEANWWWEWTKWVPGVHDSWFDWEGGWFPWDVSIPLPVLWVTAIRTGGLFLYWFFDGRQLSTADEQAPAKK